MSLLAKAAAEGLKVSDVRQAVRKVCENKLPQLGYSKPQTITKYKCHEMAQLIDNDIDKIHFNDDIKKLLKHCDIKDDVTESMIKDRNHYNTQALYGCKHGVEFWFKCKKYVKLGNNWVHVSNYKPQEKTAATYKLKTQGFYLYKGLRYDVAKELSVDLSQTLNEVLDTILK